MNLANPDKSVVPSFQHITLERAQEIKLVFQPERDSVKLRKLADDYNIWLGGSSWNYPGWIGKVYNRNYGNSKQAFVESKFERTAIEELPERMPAVGNDSTYYNFPSEKQLEKLDKTLPHNFRMSFKVPKSITLPRYDFKHRLAGQNNPTYMDAPTFIENFLNPVTRTLGDRVGAIMFEFSPFHFDRNSYTPVDFVRKAFHFFEQLPHSNHRYAIEIRDTEFFEMKIHPYLDLLDHFGIAHILNQQSRMPALYDQMQIPGVLSADFTVVRALTPPYMTHDEAVAAFLPYDHIKTIDAKLRLGLVALMKHSVEQKRQMIVNLNNRTEGCSPDTLAVLIALFEEEMGIRLN